MRANYIMKLSLSVPYLQSPFLPCYEQVGWHSEDGRICITWDDGQTPEVEESEDESSVDGESGLSDEEDELTLRTSAVARELDVDSDDN